jgi:hypothetical protein
MMFNQPDTTTRTTDTHAATIRTMHDITFKCRGSRASPTNQSKLCACEEHGAIEYIQSGKSNQACNFPNERIVTCCIYATQPVNVI